MRGKKAMAKALAFFLLSIYLLYSWSFYFGGYARWTELKNGAGDTIDAGTIFFCIFCLIFASMALAGVSAMYAPIVEG
jgi:predicted phage tail protein